MIKANEPNKRSAEESIAKAAAAQTSAIRKTRWFGWSLTVVGLLTIPVTLAAQGPLIPFLAITALVLLALAGLDRYMRMRGVVPRSSKSQFRTAVGIWFVLTIVLRTFVTTSEPMILLVTAVLAASPFFIFGLLSLTGRPISSSPKPIDDASAA